MVEHRATGATRRARQMATGGLLTGHMAGIMACGLALMTGSRAALIGTALGFTAAVIFRSVGQAVGVVAYELEPVQGPELVLVSYVARMMGARAGIWFVTSHPQLGPMTDRNRLAAAAVATVLTWTTSVVVVTSWQRVPIYDIHDQG